MNGNITFHPVEHRSTGIRIKRPRASEQECLHAELVEQAELLDAHASDIRRMSAKLNRESLTASGWMGDLHRYLMDQPSSRQSVCGTSAPPRTDLPALDRRGPAILFAVTLVPWLVAALLLYLCWTLIT
jgi:hypothetical protein